MNIIMVIGGLQMKVPDSPEQEAQVMIASIKKAERLYRNAIRAAVDRWQTIQDSELSGPGEKEQSDVMMLFMDRILRWTMSSYRYNY